MKTAKLYILILKMLNLSDHSETQHFCIRKKKKKNFSQFPVWTCIF